jgi:outer membrane protein TolC
LLPVRNKVEIQNDSLVIYEQDGETQFEYKRNNQESLAIQKAIFDEKRKIIENCLFGVDINPNSVQICCLRLWIELLKSTYYDRENGKLQTLPNIDINIKDSLKAYEKDLTLAKAEVNESELSNNTSLRQLDMSKNMLERSNKLLKTNFLPTVGMQLQGSYTSYSNENWNVFNYKYSPSSTLALSVTVPIFQASNWTKLKSNRLQISQLADTRTNTMRQLSMAAQSYRQNMLTTISKLESDREAVRKADKAVTISAKRYDVGRGTILELNQSETALTQAELTYRQSIYDYLTNKADLDYTLGRE